MQSCATSCQYWYIIALLVNYIYGLVPYSGDSPLIQQILDTICVYTCNLVKRGLWIPGGCGLRSGFQAVDLLVLQPNYVAHGYYTGLPTEVQVGDGLGGHGGQGLG